MTAMTRAFHCPSCRLERLKPPPDPRMPLLHGIVWLAFGIGASGHWPRSVPSGTRPVLWLFAFARISRRRPDPLLRPLPRASANSEAYREADDAALVERVARRKTTRHSPSSCVVIAPGVRLAVSILGRGFVSEAEDVAQDVMVRVYHAPWILSRRFDFWIVGLSHRVQSGASTSKARMRYRAPHVSDDALAALPSADRRADDELQAAERRRGVMECTAELPGCAQPALRLHYWLGASIAIAEMLDAPENTVKSYLHRARQLAACDAD